MVSRSAGFTIERKIEREGKLRGVALKAGDVRLSINQDDGAKDGTGSKERDFHYGSQPIRISTSLQNGLKSMVAP